LADDATRSWADFWQQGHLTSLPSGFACNYDGEFLAFWNQQFASLKPHSLVLDVCAGNGSIALLAQNYSEQHQLLLDIKAVDAANIDITALIKKYPDIADQIQAIKFVPNTPFEELAETANSTDLIVSQYGIEYTDWEVSAKKIHRLLKPGGYFSIVCHAVDSKIMIQMAMQQRDFARLNNLEIFSLRMGNERSLECQSTFVKELDARIDTIYGMFKENRTSDVLANVGRELEQILQLTQKDFNAGLNAFIRFCHGVNISYFTSTDLTALRDRLQRFPDWFKSFEHEGLEMIQSGDIPYHTGEKAGQCYRFRKPV